MLMMVTMYVMVIMMVVMVVMGEQELELRARLTQSSLHHCPPVMRFKNMNMMIFIKLMMTIMVVVVCTPKYF